MVLSIIFGVFSGWFGGVLPPRSAPGDRGVSQADERRPYLLEGRFGRTGAGRSLFRAGAAASSGHNDIVEAFGDEILALAEGLADEPLEPVAGNGGSEGSADRDAQPRKAAIIFGGIDGQKAVSGAAIPRENGLELPVAQQSFLLWKGEPLQGITLTTTGPDCPAATGRERLKVSAAAQRRARLTFGRF